MKRVALSVIGGLVIPVLYTVIAVLLAPYIHNRALVQLAMFPVRWPIVLLFRLRLLLFENKIEALIYIIVCNVFLYSLLTYFLLWRFSRRKKTTQHSPPTPPTFV